MNYNELIERLRTESLDSTKAALSIMDLCMDAASAIEELTAELDAAIAGQETLQKELARVKKERDALKNELCYKCGNYKQAHNGWCDSCRWKR